MAIRKIYDLSISWHAAILDDNTGKLLSIPQICIGPKRLSDYIYKVYSNPYLWYCAGHHSLSLRFPKGSLEEVWPFPMRRELTELVPRKSGASIVRGDSLKKIIVCYKVCCWWSGARNLSTILVQVRYCGIGPPSQPGASLISIPTSTVTSWFFVW